MSTAQIASEYVNTIVENVANENPACVEGMLRFIKHLRDFEEMCDVLHIPGDVRHEALGALLNQILDHPLVEYVMVRMTLVDSVEIVSPEEMVGIDKTFGQEDDQSTDQRES